MRFESNSNGPGRVIDRRGQPKPKGWKNFDGKYTITPSGKPSTAHKLGLSAYSSASLRSRKDWTVGLPSRPGPNRKRPR